MFCAWQVTCRLHLKGVRNQIEWGGKIVRDDHAAALPGFHSLQFRIFMSVWLWANYVVRCSGYGTIYEGCESTWVFPLIAPWLDMNWLLSAVVLFVCLFGYLFLLNHLTVFVYLFWLLMLIISLLMSVLILYFCFVLSGKRKLGIDYTTGWYFAVFHWLCCGIMCGVKTRSLPAAPTL